MSAEPKGAYEDLLKTIERLSNTTIRRDLLIKNPVDLKALRAREAHEAALEIQKENRQNRLLYIQKIHQSGRINQDFVFGKIKVDAQNQEAVGLAKMFCHTVSRPLVSVPMLVISGSEGSGKSVLCHAMANELLEMGINDVSMCEFEEIRQTFLFNQNEEKQERRERDDRYEHFASVKVLILDGLCQNREGLSVFDQRIFSRILRERYAARLPMAITTPCELDSLRLALGDFAYESLKQYEAVTAVLYGGSRRQPLRHRGRVIS